MICFVRFEFKASYPDFAISYPSVLSTPKKLSRVPPNTPKESFCRRLSFELTSVDLELAYVGYVFWILAL